MDGRIRFTLPQESFTPAELRAFAGFLLVVADENDDPPREIAR